jgi:formyltetrahydrofolate-dependent phosphoribosylglycinamide formyltransferase|tara:strand:- start:177 stop:719 length:543 start_codon:yes stop_codon:yes gene_type:complete
MRLGVMCSGNGTNFENILRTCWYDEVVLMIHNKKKCGALKRAAKFGINHCYVNAKDEEEMIKLFEAYRVDLIVLAGYMRIIKNPSAFPAPMINVHPSLLPKYKGLHAVEQAMESGDKITGCTVHYVNEELDGGDIILQGEVPILPEDTVESLTKAIQRKEYALLPLAIEHVKQGLQVAVD